MATLDTSKKAPITVTDPNGNSINEALAQGDVFTDDVDIVSIEHGNFGAIFAVAQGPGTAIVGVMHEGGQGTLSVDVEAATLTITLGPPVPK